MRTTIQLAGSLLLGTMLMVGCTENTPTELTDKTDRLQGQWLTPGEEGASKSLAIPLEAASPAAVAAVAEFANGSFETGDYTGWTLFEGGAFTDPFCGTWGIATNGQTINPLEFVFDFFDGINVQQFSPGLPHIYTATDGNFVALQLQLGSQTHRMFQDITLPSGATTISWAMEYTNHSLTAVGGPGVDFNPGQVLRVTVRDPTTDAILSTLFVTEPGGVSPQSIPMTTFTGDVSAFGGQTVRIGVDMIVNDFFFDAAFDNFTTNALPDSDGDGTPNAFDDCPNDFGPPDNNGCPRPEVPEGTPIPNGPSSCEIEVDGKFGTNACVEWADVTPVVSLGGESIVYQAFDEVDGEFLYLMYDWIGSGTPLQPGDASGQVRFFVGTDVFDVTFVQGGPNSTGGLDDDVNVLRNGLPFDNSQGAIVGAVDRNNTSPNFAQPHNLFELKVRLLETAETPGGLPPDEGGLYSPDPAFWGAALPGSPLTQVSSIFLDIDPGGVVVATTIQALQLVVDIKPGSDPNCIKASSKGNIPVAVLAAADLDVSAIDVASISMNGVAPVRSSLNKDVGGDGQPDLVLHFRTGDLRDAGLLNDDGRTLVVTGELNDGTPIIGSDVIFLAGGPNCFD